MMRRLGCMLLSCVMMIACVFTRIENVQAEDYSDGTYWSNYCSNSANSSSDACKGYVQYLQAQSSSYKKQMEDIQSQRQAIAADLEGYDKQLKQYQADEKALQEKIDAKQAEIDAKQVEIDNKQIEIENKQVEIDNTQAEVDALDEMVKQRMVRSQSSMRFPKELDLLMGAKSFEELLLIYNGLSAIAERDNQTLTDLANMIDLLNQQKVELDQQKQELEVAKGELEEQKAALVEDQNEKIILQEKMQVIIDEAQKQAGLLEAQYTKTVADIAQIQSTISKIDLDAVPSTDGWTKPIAGSWISAGTWHYPGGSIHLGADYAVGVGTPIRAVADGLVIHSSDGCPTYGYLGNRCGYQRGAAGGGNQVSILVKVKGELFAVSYAHMMLGSPIAVGTTVSAGQQIGLVGASGNTSGPHSHIAIFKLGDASNFSTYAKTWNGDLSFGCGWTGSYDGYGRRCGVYGVPCRIRPESVLG